MPKETLESHDCGFWKYHTPLLVMFYHEPHLIGKIPFRNLRIMGRRLTRLGPTAEKGTSFVYKEFRHLPNEPEMEI